MAADAPARRNGRRRGAQSAQPSPPPNALVASAARLTAEKVRRASAGAEWQGRAWDYYDAVGGLAYVSEFYRNALARIRLVPKRIAPDGTLTDVEGGAPVDILQAFGGGPLAQRALIGSLGVHMFVPGEAYLVGRDVLDEQGAETGAQSWAVHSTDELTQAGSGYTLNIGDGDIEQLDEATLVVRIWQPHPRRSWLPNSPVLHVLTDLAEYVGLAQWVQATIDSRLAGAGLLLLPQEVTFAEGAGQPAQGEADPFIAELTDTMVAAIKDRDSAAAVVPLIAKMPGEWLDKVRLITFWSEFSEHVIPMREGAVDRVEMGLSIPKGVMSGTVDSNHWPCDEETEVYTDQGWVGWQGLSAGTEVLTLDPTSGMSTFEPISGVRAEHVVDRVMIGVEGHYHSSLTTPDHRWPILRSDRREWCRTEDFAANTANSTDRTMILGARHADLPSEPKLADWLVEILAWAATDGDATPPSRGSRVRIRQRRPDNVTLIDALMVNVDHRRYVDRSADVIEWQLTSEATAAVAEHLRLDGTRWHLRETTVRQMTAAQLELLLATAERANGGSTTGRTVFAVDPARLEPFSHAAVLAGYRVTMRQRNTLSGWNKTRLWWLSWGSRRTFTPQSKHLTEHRYTGVIFCPQVPIGRSFLARRHGHLFYTGNSAWAIADDTIKFHIEPAIQGICAALTAGYYQPALEAAGLTPAEAARFLLWYDATALTQRPNSVPETTELYDRGLVRGGVLLRVAGLNPDTDMAEEADLARIERVKAADSATPPGVGIGEQGPAGGTPQRPGPPPAPATLVPASPGLTAAITAGGIVLPAEVEATFAGDTPPPLELPREMGDGPPPCDCTAEALTATVDGLLFRALEIVGGRMRGRLPHGAPNDGLAAHQVHEHHHSRPKPSVLFANLWKTVPELAAQVGVDPELLTAALDTELRDTVTAMRPYDPAAAARIAADLMVG